MSYTIKNEEGRTAIYDETGKFVCYVQNERVANELITFWKTMGF